MPAPAHPNVPASANGRSARSRTGLVHRFLPGSKGSCGLGRNRERAVIIEVDLQQPRPPVGLVKVDQPRSVLVPRIPAAANAMCCLMSVSPLSPQPENRSCRTNLRRQVVRERFQRRLTAGVGASDVKVSLPRRVVPRQADCLVQCHAPGGRGSVAWGCTLPRGGRLMASLFPGNSVGLFAYEPKHSDGRDCSALAARAAAGPCRTSPRGGACRRVRGDARDL